MEKGPKKRGKRKKKGKEDKKKKKRKEEKKRREKRKWDRQGQVPRFRPLIAIATWISIGNAT